MLFTGISAKKLGELLVLRRSIKILSKRSEIDYLKNKPAQSNSQLNMPDVAHEIKISIDRLFVANFIYAYYNMYDKRRKKGILK